MSEHDARSGVRAAFDACVAGSDPAMVVVLAEGDGEVDACLVGFHSQCSMEPPRYAVWLSQDNHTFRLACRAPALTVHFLDADQHELAERVGGSTADRDASKPDRLDVVRHRCGSLRLAEARRWFAGRVTATFSAGDHTAFVLDPVVAVTGSGEPLRLARATDITPGHRVGDST